MLYSTEEGPERKRFERNREMTNEEARKMFGIGEADVLNADGIKSMIDSTQKYLGTWSLAKADRAKAEKEIEALTVLYAEAVK